MLEPETVAEAIVDRIMRQEGGVLHLPKIHSWYGASIRGFPDWIQHAFRKATFWQTKALDIAGAKVPQEQQAEEEGMGVDSEESLKEKGKVVGEAIAQERPQK